METVWRPSWAISWATTGMTTRTSDTDNSRNGHSSKTLRTSFWRCGEISAVPRDRKSEFEPKVLRKNRDLSVSQDIEEKILSMYARA